METEEETVGRSPCEPSPTMEEWEKITEKMNPFCNCNTSQLHLYHAQLSCASSSTDREELK
jgi:hypothetical protein